MATADANERVGGTWDTFAAEHESDRSSTASQSAAGEKHASPGAARSEMCGASGSPPAGDGQFVAHAVSRGDTLAGLAIRYNIAVSDIKRANGLMSEGMMWSRCARPAQQAHVERRPPLLSPIPVAAQPLCCRRIRQKDCCSIAHVAMLRDDHTLEAVDCPCAWLCENALQRCHTLTLLLLPWQDAEGTASLSCGCNRS